MTTIFFSGFDGRIITTEQARWTDAISITTSPEGFVVEVHPFVDAAADWEEFHCVEPEVFTTFEAAFEATQS